MTILVDSGQVSIGLGDKRIHATLWTLAEEVRVSDPDGSRALREALIAAGYDPRPPNPRPHKGAQWRGPRPRARTV